LSDLAEANADVARIEADLVKARAACVRARNALARINFEEGMPIAYRSESRRVSHAAAPDNPHTDRRKANADRRRSRAALVGSHASHAIGQIAGTDRRKANGDRRCARPAPANTSHAELAVKSTGWSDKLTSGASNDASPGFAIAANLSDGSAIPRSKQFSGQRVRAVEESATGPTDAQKERRRFTRHFSAQEAGKRNTRASRPLVWQSVQLASLTLAYLQYYYVDVYLQIVMLPSVSAQLAG
jgi:hypothetical protein